MLLDDVFLVDQIDGGGNSCFVQTTVTNNFRVGFVIAGEFLCTGINAARSVVGVRDRNRRSLGKACRQVEYAKITNQLTGCRIRRVTFQNLNMDSLLSIRIGTEPLIDFVRTGVFLGIMM